MARARNRQASPEEVAEQQDEVMQDSGNALQSDEPLNWRAGKPIAVGDLLRRLKTLAEELQSLSQDHADRASLVPKAQELANQQLLGHKDKGVKAWTLLCIVEMFRLLAPDAPYKGGQLKQIFDIFTNAVVPALASPSDPYSQQYLAILTSLTTIKSIVLLTDIPGSDTLILNLFNNCFDVMSGSIKGGQGEQLPKNVEYHMTNMLCTLVDECTALPNGVVDIILAQFLRADPNAMAHGSRKGDIPASLVVRETSPAYNMARSVCNTCADKMSRAMGQYFSSVLIDASESFTATNKTGKPKGKKRTQDESDDESENGLHTPPPEHDLGEVEKAHRLLRELWRSSPDVVQNIIPQMEAESSAENVQLRAMAVQTVGDMAAGVGAAGPPPPVPMDPAAYPSQSLDTPTVSSQYQNVLLAPAAPHAFASVYPAAYQAFMDRHRDKAPTVRSAWTTAVGRIISTSGGGKGLDAEQEAALLQRLSQMLVDHDERVRLAAVQSIAGFDFNTVMQKLGSNGSVTTAGSVLGNLADRIRDGKRSVRVAALELLGRIWGVAAGAIAEGSERVREVLGAIPTKVFMAVYINDRDINACVQKVLFESLLPITYPPIKAKPTEKSDSQRIHDSQAGTAQEAADPDAIRAERILVLVRDLDPKAKAVFFQLQAQSAARAKYLERYFAECNNVYGNASDIHESEAAEKTLNKLISAIAGSCPDPTVAKEHLDKFAKLYDRRSYQLIRFCYSPESDYRKVFKATKELVKRMEEAPTGMAEVLETLLPLVLGASILVYNRSHVPAIMDFARTDEKALGGAAHEVLSQISASAPEVFKVHVHELCEGLKRQAPSAQSPNNATAVSELKACAGFARRFPKEMPQNRDFFKAMTAFAKHGNPPEAAKHAVTVIVSSAEKREMYVRDIMKYCLADYEYGAESFLSRLAAISQLRLIANKETEDHTEEIMDIAVRKILMGVDTMADEEDPEWKDEIDDALCSKLWALRILVSGLRGVETSGDPSEAKELISANATKVFKLLNTIIACDGGFNKNDAQPKHYRAHLRLAAADQLLKLSCNRVTDQFLSPRDFTTLSKVCQDQLLNVRAGFAKTLKKYLGQGKLPNRFYAFTFLYAWEPNKATRESMTTWLKSRAALSAKQKDTVMESVLARFLSLLAHHQDFSTEENDLEDTAQYIMFYLKNVATQDNIPLIYHIAQRLKNVEDGIDPDKSEHLYVVSDLAEGIIRSFVELQHWSLQLYSGKVRLPTGIFAPLSSHGLAQEIGKTRYLPESFDEERIETLVKQSIRNKKRKSDGGSTRPAKKTKSEGEKSKKKAVSKALKAPKTPKPESVPKKTAGAVSSSDRRRSARASNSKNYVEDASDEEIDEDDVAEWRYEDEDGDDVDEGDSNKENQHTDLSLPASGPSHAALPVGKNKHDVVVAGEEDVVDEVVVDADEIEDAPQKKRGKATQGRIAEHEDAPLAVKGRGRLSKSSAAADHFDLPHDEPAAVQPSSSVKKGRGRPKRTSAEMNEFDVPTDDSVPEVVSSARKGRGMARKTPALVEEDAEPEERSSAEIAQDAKRNRGRSAKTPLVAEEHESPEEVAVVSEVSKAKKGSGRRKKVSAAKDDAEVSGEESAAEPAPAKKGRGKSKSVAAAREYRDVSDEEPAAEPACTKKGRGWTKQISKASDEFDVPDDDEDAAPIEASSPPKKARGKLKKAAAAEELDAPTSKEPSVVPEETISAKKRAVKGAAKRAAASRAKAGVAQKSTRSTRAAAK
ncbi:sister chromatid cohesion and DNA repair protein (BimD) [Teratosphaeria destructans]|uniref:Sister chromatid cohesion and DNA repair protein (BimD) n=1 Tax=Teratosphaeria destructans TaxID=418781 RepID=A0A9W7W3V7_9PEZI|nr:sister chromatid cohesion and DNA repair protein (BimD) [Teratosphaeria destructans]